jgi:hypothetical protein
VFFGEADSFLFIEREPLFGVRRLVRVVSIHGADVPADKTGGAARRHRDSKSKGPYRCVRSSVRSCCTGFFISCGARSHSNEHRGSFRRP